MMLTLLKTLETSKVYRNTLIARLYCLATSNSLNTHTSGGGKVTDVAN